MRVRCSALLLVVSILAFGSARAEPEAGAASSAPKPPRLFDTHETLALDLEADWGAVRRDRKGVPTQHPATLTYAGPSGTVSFPIQVETRGRSRLRETVCEFPPLRLDIPKEGRKGTLFRGIGELKLVTHCQRSASYEQNVLLEYLLYRSYAVLTDQSYRVRLMQVRYFAPGGKKPLWERAGFVIEDASDLAKRLGAESVPENVIEASQVDAAVASRVEMFFYMIGMTDFSMVARPDGPCCHNARMLRPPGAALVPVPFDFDQTGVVDPEYALPDPRLKIRSVTERKFRGHCREPGLHAAAISELREKRAQITALFEAETKLQPNRRKKALAFLDGFFQWASDPARVEKTLAEECRQPTS